MKRTIALCVLLIMVLGLTACKTHIAYTFDMDNGDRIKVKLDTTGGYSLTANTPFQVKIADEVQCEGTFLQGNAFEEYVQVISADKNARVMSEDISDGNRYLFWIYDESEFNYVIQVADSDTCILLSSTISKMTAMECFARLTITADEQPFK